MYSHQAVRAQPWSAAKAPAFSKTTLARPQSALRAISRQDDCLAVRHRIHTASFSAVRLASLGHVLASQRVDA